MHDIMSKYQQRMFECKVPSRLKDYNTEDEDLVTSDTFSSRLVGSLQSDVAIVDEVFVFSIGVIGALLFVASGVDRLAVGASPACERLLRSSGRDESVF